MLEMTLDHLGVETEEPSPDGVEEDVPSKLSREGRNGIVKRGLDDIVNSCGVELNKLSRKRTPQQMLEVLVEAHQIMASECVPFCHLSRS